MILFIQFNVVTRLQKWIFSAFDQASSPSNPQFYDFFIILFGWNWIFSALKSFSWFWIFFFFSSLKFVYLDLSISFCFVSWVKFAVGLIELEVSYVNFGQSVLICYFAYFLESVLIQNTHNTPIYFNKWHPLSSLPILRSDPPESQIHHLAITSLVRDRMGCGCVMAGFWVGWRERERGHRRGGI